MKPSLEAVVISFDCDTALLFFSPFCASTEGSPPLSHPFSGLGVVRFACASG